MILSDQVVSWHHETMTSWHHDIVTSWNHDILTWHNDIMKPWHLETMTSWHHDILTWCTSWHRDIVTSWHHDIFISGEVIRTSTPRRLAPIENIFSPESFTTVDTLYRTFTALDHHPRFVEHNYRQHRSVDHYIFHTCQYKTVCAKLGLDWVGGLHQLSLGSTCGVCQASPGLTGNAIYQHHVWYGLLDCLVDNVYHLLSIVYWDLLSNSLLYCLLTSLLSFF